MSLPRGARLGPYEALFELASGGMGTVCAGRRLGAERFEKPVALKVVHEHLARDPRFASMFIDEARLAAAVRSRHVVQVYDFDSDVEGTGTVYLAMEMVFGVSLKQLLAIAARTERPVPIAVAVAFLRDVARGLHAAHEARDADGRSLQIVHRDVSPQNLLVSSEGYVLLTDFGIAHAVERLHHTATGELIGKPSYMAPEQLTGTGVDRRVDVYALGAVAWELFTGTRRFKVANVMELAYLLASAPSRSLEDVAPHVPIELVRIVDRCLARSPQDRFGTARELEEALEEAWPPASEFEVREYVMSVAGDPITAMERRYREERVRVRDATPTERPIASDELPTQPEVVEGARRSKRGAAWLVGAAVLSIVVVAFGVAGWPGGETAAPRDPAPAVARAMIANPVATASAPVAPATIAAPVAHRERPEVAGSEDVEQPVRPARTHRARSTRVVAGRARRVVRPVAPREPTTSAEPAIGARYLLPRERAARGAR